MSSDPCRELRRLQDSLVFRTYKEVRWVYLCYSMMESKLAELRNAVRRIGTSPLSCWNSYDALESETMELCQLLADFLSRLYFCKNLAAICVKRHGMDPKLNSLKHGMLGLEASVMVNLRNYVVHVDMMPLEIDTFSGRVVFTCRCRGDGVWGTMQKRFLRETDAESLFTSYSEMLTCFYGDTSGCS